MKHSVRSLRPGGFPLELCGSESILVNETFGMIFETGRVSTPGTPLTYFNDGGGGGPKDFFGSDILAKRDFLGSMKDAGIFWGRENNTGIFLGIVFFISLN